MFPASTHKGQAVAAFPDVCKTPSPGGPVPIPYPTMAAGGTKGATKPVHGTKPVHRIKPVQGTKSGFAKGSGDAAALKNRLGILHQKLMSMPAGNSTQWHAALDDYVMTTSELYKSLSDR